MPPTANMAGIGNLLKRIAVSYAPTYGQSLIPSILALSAMPASGRFRPLAADKEGHGLHARRETIDNGFVWPPRPSPQSVSTVLIRWTGSGAGAIRRRQLDHGIQAKYGIKTAYVWMSGGQSVFKRVNDSTIPIQQNEPPMPAEPAPT
jgi:hypothetical protein